MLLRLAPAALILRLKIARLVLRRGIEVVNQHLLRSTNPAPVLRAFGAHVAPSAVVYGPLVIHNADGDYRNLTIGPLAHVGRDVLLDLSGPLQIGEEATVSMRCVLLTHFDLGERPLAQAYPRKIEPLWIQPGSYLGANATVLAGCEIGTMAVVGAGAVVTRPVPGRTAVAGVPARPFKTRGLALVGADVAGADRAVVPLDVRQG